MRSVETPHVQLILDDGLVPPALQTALNRLGARVSIRSLDKALASGVSPSADACVILPGSSGRPDLLDRLIADASERACGTLVIPGPAGSRSHTAWGISAEPADQMRSACLGRIASGRAESMSADELTGRLKALCEIRHPLRRMREELMCLRQRDAELLSGARDLREQLQLAGQIQQELLPEPKWEIGPLSIATLYLPADFVSGDIYDVSRLDSDCVALAIVDATGHGLPAALLTIFARNALRGKEIIDEGYRIIEPDALLARLNRELYQTNLTQCQYITALHAIYDRRSRRIRWARGGLPYPILLRPGQPARQIRSEGALLGALEEQTFALAEHSFEPGDVLLLYTDGLEKVFLDRGGEHPTDGLLFSPWLDQLAEEGVEAALAAVRKRVLWLSARAWPRDDLSAIVLSMKA